MPLRLYFSAKMSLPAARVPWSAQATTQLPLLSIVTDGWLRSLPLSAETVMSPVWGTPAALKTRAWISYV